MCIDGSCEYQGILNNGDAVETKEELYRGYILRANLNELQKRVARKVVDDFLVSLETGWIQERR